MEWLTNEVLFYGGIVIMGVSILAAIVWVLTSKIRAVKLEAKLDAEYGEKSKH